MGHNKLAAHTPNSQTIKTRQFKIEYGEEFRLYTLHFIKKTHFCIEVY